MDETAHINLPGRPTTALTATPRAKRSRRSRSPGLLVDIKDHTLAIGTSTAAIPSSSLASPCSGSSRSSRSPTRPSPPSREGHIKFTPAMYSKTYFEWMRNIHDWCISRQLWWGHRIPAGTARCDKTPSPATRPKLRHCGSDADSSRKPTCSTPGSPPACCPSRSSAGPSQTRDLAPSIPRSCSSPASTSSSSGWPA